MSVAESFPSASDHQIIQQAINEGRKFLTEDKDFGEWVFANGKNVAGFIITKKLGYK